MVDRRNAPVDRAEPCRLQWNDPQRVLRAIYNEVIYSEAIYNEVIYSEAIYKRSELNYATNL